MKFSTGLRPGLLGWALAAILSVAQAAPNKTSPLIDAGFLKTRLNSVTVIDARTESLYAKGHLPGAISLPWLDVSQMPRSALLLSDRELADILSSRGIDSSSQLVVYGEGKEGWGEEGRIYWTLVYLGAKRVSVLDGGIAAWKASGGTVTTEPTPTSSRTFKPSAQTSVRMVKDALVPLVEKRGVQLLDVRETEEFAGARKYSEARGGRLPGSVNIPWKSFFDADGKVASKTVILAQLKKHGIDPSKPIVAYCTGGVRSGFAFLALRSAGVSKVSNYEGSFWEWAKDSALAVESGPPAGAPAGPPK